MIGAPFQLVIGDKGLADGVVEIKIRRTGIKSRIVPSELVAHLKQLSFEAHPSTGSPLS
ncbi:MAG: His/Gly/Thr/Pro-type tRNA ligase C-terminal domain-containing protein [Nitrospirota bacterium]